MSSPCPWAQSHSLFHLVLKKALGKGSQLTTHGKCPKCQTNRPGFTSILCQVLAVQA